MKRRAAALSGALLLLTAALWVADKIPFVQHIDRQIQAEVYRDGIAVGWTTVSIRGEKTRYLFRAGSFVGEFRVPYVEETDVDDLQTRVEWHGGDHLQSISHFYQGALSLAGQRGVVSYLLISENMEEFALMTTEQDVIATSPALCELYTSHVSYHDGSVTVTDLEDIPKL